MTDGSAGTLKRRSILSFSLERWNDVWRSRHHIMLRMARENTVLFASSPYYIHDAVRSFRKKVEDADGLSKVTDNLYTYVPPRWLPVNYRYPKLDALVKEVRCWQIRRAMRRLRMERPILYLWHPSFVDMIGHFDEALVVYHCYDEYGSFSQDPRSRQSLLAQERALLERADIVFVASEALAERRHQYNPNVHVVENAVDYPLFSKAQAKETPVPEDLTGVPRPIVGCVVTLMTFVNIQLLTEVFRRRPDWSLVLIGVERTPERAASVELQRLQGLSNVHFLGRRSLQALPGYLRGCDVCVIAYLLEDATMACSSPLKLYEYLAAGKPVVSTSLPLMRHLSPAVAFADNPDGWIDAIEAAMLEKGPEKIEARQTIARGNTWEQRAEFISRSLADELSRQPSA